MRARVRSQVRQRLISNSCADAPCSLIIRVQRPRFWYAPLFSTSKRQISFNSKKIKYVNWNVGWKRNFIG
ncbi:hypothetical protein B5X24_HaOG213634 [Helicoverpa armigera]|nr:hypothetical protein B5X24_HaOG213634 [Helicoverpa armigera]